MDMDINDDKYIDDKYIYDKYIKGIKYVYDNIDILMQNITFKNFIDNSETILKRYHQIFNTDDRNEVIAKYFMLTLYIIENNNF